MIIGENELIVTNDGKFIILIVTKGEKTVLTAMDTEEYFRFQTLLHEQHADITNQWRKNNAA